MEYESLQTSAYNRLLRMIQNQEMEFTTMYSETRIAKQFSISRTPVRDALNRLASERYIDILPNRGFRLHKSTREDVYEAYHARSAIESYCAMLLAKNHLSERASACIQRMQELKYAQERLVRQQEDFELREYWDYDLEFHICLINYAGVDSFIQSFNSYMHFFMAHYVKDYRRLSREYSTLEEHQRIIDALKNGDPDEASKAALYHMDQTLMTTLSNFKNEAT